MDWKWCTFRSILSILAPRLSSSFSMLNTFVLLEVCSVLELLMTNSISICEKLHLFWALYMHCRPFLYFIWDFIWTCPCPCKEFIWLLFSWTLRHWSPKDHFHEYDKNCTASACSASLFCVSWVGPYWKTCFHSHNTLCYLGFEDFPEAARFLPADALPFLLDRLVWDCCVDGVCVLSNFLPYWIPSHMSHISHYPLVLLCGDFLQHVWSFLPGFWMCCCMWDKCVQLHEHLTCDWETHFHCLSWNHSNNNAKLPSDLGCVYAYDLRDSCCLQLFLSHFLPLNSCCKTCQSFPGWSSYSTLSVASFDVFFGSIVRVLTLFSMFLTFKKFYSSFLAFNFILKVLNQTSHFIGYFVINGNFLYIGFLNLINIILVLFGPNLFITFHFSCWVLFSLFLHWSGFREWLWSIIVFDAFIFRFCNFVWTDWFSYSHPFNCLFFCDRLIR